MILLQQNHTAFGRCRKTPLALLTALPTLVVYILLGRTFIRGLLAGSVKG